MWMADQQIQSIQARRFCRTTSWGNVLIGFQGAWPPPPRYWLNLQSSPIYSNSGYQPSKLLSPVPLEQYMSMNSKCEVKCERQNNRRKTIFGSLRILAKTSRFSVRTKSEQKLAEILIGWLSETLSSFCESETSACFVELGNWFRSSI